jgi:hypothetical protein
MAAKVVLLRRSKMQHNATSSKGRQGNDVYRVREHLTEAEIEKLLAALKQNRYGQRDWLIGLLIYRHGLPGIRGLRSPLGRHRPDETHNRRPQAKGQYGQ